MALSMTFFPWRYVYKLFRDAFRDAFHDVFPWRYVYKSLRDAFRDAIHDAMCMSRRTGVPRVYAGFAVADDERYTYVDQMQLDRVRFRRRIHQSELILAK